MSLPPTPAQRCPGQGWLHTIQKPPRILDLDLIHITETMRPNPDTRTCKLPWYENTARRGGLLLGLLILSSGSHNPGNTTFNVRCEQRLMRPRLMLLTDTHIWSWESDRQWRETRDNPNWNLKLKSSLLEICLRMTSSKGGKVSLSRE